MNAKRVDIFHIIILALAASLRLAFPGANQLIWDEVGLQYLALRLARHGEWTWAATTAYSSILPVHSPFTVYLASIPYLFSADPRLGRLWVGFLGTVAVSLIYLTTRRYFGQTASTLTGILFATHSAAVDWSRIGWNPSYALVFIAAWVCTGLLGFREGKRWAQAVHWVALSLAIQSHPGNILLVPLSIIFCLSCCWRERQRAAPIVRATALGWLLAGITVIPWMIGIISFNARRGSLPDVSKLVSAEIAGARQQETFDATKLINTFAGIAGSVGRRSAPSMLFGTGPMFASNAEGNWWPPAWIEVVYVGQASLAAIAAVAAIAVGVRRSHIPHLWFGALALWPLIAFVVSPSRTMAYYMMSLVFGAIPCLGIGLSQLADRIPRVRWWLFALAGIFAASQAWLTIATIRDQYIAGNIERFAAPLQTYLDVLRVLRANGKEIIFIAENDDGKRRSDAQIKYWQVTNAGASGRAIDNGIAQGIPIPAEGAVFVSPYPAPSLPALFGEGNLTGELITGEPMFRWVLVQSPPTDSIDLFPATFSLFASGARILGIDFEHLPSPGQDWPVLLLWKIERTDIADNYSFSLRLVDEHGTRFGQADGLSLDGSLWREGDTVLNRFSIPVRPDYASGEPRVQLLMYKADAIEVTDEGGTPIASEMMLVPDEAATDDLGWFEYHPAGRYEALTQHSYFARFNEQIDLLGFRLAQTQGHPGESIPVTLYWTAAQVPTRDYHVFVHLRDEGGQLVGQSDKINPAGSPTTHWATDGYLLDEHMMTVAADTPPGRYQLFIGLWEESTGRATAYDESGASWSDGLPVGIDIIVEP